MKTKTLIVLVSFSTLATACVINDASPPARGVVVNGPPPAPMNEARSPAPPNGQASWVAGYWHWNGMQYTWIPGHWESAPAGSTWRAPTYSLHDGVYVYEPGGWGKR